MCCLKRPLKATTHGAAFDNVTKIVRLVLVVEDIDDIFFCLWRHLVFAIPTSLQWTKYSFLCIMLTAPWASILDEETLFGPLLLCILMVIMRNQMKLLAKTMNMIQMKDEVALLFIAYIDIFQSNNISFQWLWLQWRCIKISLHDEAIMVKEKVLLGAWLCCYMLSIIFLARNL